MDVARFRGRSAAATIAAAAGNAAVRHLARNIGHSIGSRLRGFRDRVSMPAQRTPRRRIGRRTRTIFRSRRPRARRSAPAGKYRRGRRYTGRRTRQFKKLNTNVSINDFAKIRAVTNLGSVILTEGSPLSNNDRFAVSLSSWATQWARKIDAYEQFKITNVQFVINPRSVVTGASRIEVAGGEIPYLCIREVNTVGPKLLIVTADEIRSTPGYRFIPLQKKRRTVINVTPSLYQVDTYVNHLSLNTTYGHNKSMPWMNIDTQSKELQLGGIEIYRPKLNIGQGNQLAWDVSVYCTILLRGNKEELIEPYGDP